MSDAGPAGEQPSRLRRLREVTGLFGFLGVIGFGGPVAHIALMERETVAKRGWVSRERFLAALAATNLLPGPNSTELGIHISHARAGALGAVAGGLAFILPAVLLMLLLSWLYFRYATVPAVGDVFYGMEPVVIALVAVTALRLFRASVVDWKLGLIFVASGALTYALPGSEIAVLIGAGLAGVVLYAPLPPAMRRAAGAALVIAATPAFAWEPAAAVDAFLLSLRTGALLFGGGYVMIPLMQHDVVQTYGWMTQEQFLDGVALGQATPGPIVVTATFVGYAAAGVPGALLATAGIFAPAFVFSIGAARVLDALMRSALANAALRGISAAVVGTILAATARLGESALVDGWTWAIGVLALFVLLRWQPQGALVLGGAALAGLAIGGIR